MEQGGALVNRQDPPERDFPTVRTCGPYPTPTRGGRLSCTSAVLRPPRRAHGGKYPEGGRPIWRSAAGRVRVLSE